MCYLFKYVRQATRDDRPPVYFPNHRFRGRNQTFVLEICARFSPVLQTKIQEGRIEKKTKCSKKMDKEVQYFLAFMAGLVVLRWMFLEKKDDD